MQHNLFHCNQPRIVLPGGNYLLFQDVQSGRRTYLSLSSYCLRYQFVMPSMFSKLKYVKTDFHASLSAERLENILHIIEDGPPIEKI